MKGTAILLLASLLLAPLSLSGPARATAAEIPVMLELVLALDRSQSIDGAMLDFQMDGHAAAFRDPRVIAAITGGNDIADGQGGASIGIAATLVTWSNPNGLAVLVPWTRIASTADSLDFAARIERAPRTALRGSTGLGSALVESARLFDWNGFVAQRRLIDIVSNGYNNAGIWPEWARDEVVARGITVNGLAILDEVPWLGQYFADRVIGGPAAFVRTATDRASFARAILEKLMTEIAAR